jgi:haloalkane dehalogenase
MNSTRPDFLRTPDEAFARLEGYPFSPHYLSDLPGYAGIRIHYLDEGDGDNVFLCLHGNPAWSYLYRHMIPAFASVGRVIAPDMIGFGKSDKPINESWHTFDAHRGMLLAFIKALDLNNITLVVQDWGGLLGLTLPMESPERFARLVIMNTAFADGILPSEGFKMWRAFSNSNPDLDLASLHRRGKSDMTQAEANAYSAPYPDATYKAAIRAFPNMVPETPHAPGAEVSRRAQVWWKNEWQGKTFAAIGARDPVLGPETMTTVLSHIGGCSPPMIVAEGGHFVQEWGALIAKAALEAFASE